MRTRTRTASGSGLQRQSRRRRGPAGVTRAAAGTPGGRITRSSAAQLNRNGSTDLDSEDDVAQRTPVLRSSLRKLNTSLKRSLSPDPLAFDRLSVKRSRHSHPQNGLYGEGSVQDDIASHSPPSLPSQRTSSLVRSRTSPTARKRKSSKGAIEIAEARPGTDGAVIPDWVSLPYYCLVQVFEHALATMDDFAGRCWLVSASRVCKAFTEPALTALYRCPPLLDRPSAHKLVALIARDPAETNFNYRPKIEKLCIDVDRVASKTYRGNPLDLATLVCHLPRLKVIDFPHPKDGLPFRTLDDNLRWHYPGNLFDALAGAGPSPAGGVSVPVIKLQGWRWNSRMMGPDLDLARIKSLHLTPSFAGLKKLCFLNFQVPSLNCTARLEEDELEARDYSYVQAVADATAVLPQLEYLSIESSTVVTDQLLQCLPLTLQTLELINCWEVTGQDFSRYLLSRGHQLRHLHLHYNQSLSLEFLQVLGRACPKLLTLVMDCKTFNHHESYNDSDPTYEHILTKDQVPDWPETIEHLELKNMRKWDADTAEMLFQSLVDKATRLPKLRILNLKSMLDIPFRQRSAVRDKWHAKLKNVFLRDFEPPLPVFNLRDRPADTAAHPTRPPKAKKTKAATSPSRQSSRLAKILPNPSSRASSVGRDLRTGVARPSYVDPDTDDEDLYPDSSCDEAGQTSEEAKLMSPLSGTEYRHGMCEVVDIQLDNQKLTENTFGMDDFLDDASDDASDEDWNGEDGDFDGELYGGYGW